ncbi:MAG: hypothetical protein KIT63_13435 [Rhodoferax sp.]|nr:hypothetical protein [Rhodoferax sp.]
MPDTNSPQQPISRAKKAHEDPAVTLAREAMAAAQRAEFWNSPADALFPRETIAAVRHCTVVNLELEAMHGGGIPYRRIGRRAFYSKADYLAWVDAQGPVVRSTAQLTPVKSQAVPA